MYGYTYVNMETPYPLGEASKPLRVHIVESTLQSGRTPPTAPKNHRWRSKEGEKRTIAVPYNPPERILRYLRDMKDGLTTALAQGKTETLYIANCTDNWRCYWQQH